MNAATTTPHVPTRQRDPWHEYAAGRLTPAEIRELAAQTPPIALARKARHRKPNRRRIVLEQAGSVTR